MCLKHGTFLCFVNKKEFSYTLLRLSVLFLAQYFYYFLFIQYTLTVKIKSTYTVELNADII